MGKKHQKGASRKILRTAQSWEQLALPTARVKKPPNTWDIGLRTYNTFLSGREKLEKAAQVLPNKAKMQALKR